MAEVDGPNRGAVGSDARADGGIMKGKLLPVLATAALGLALPYLAAYCAKFTQWVFGMRPSREAPLEWLYVQHAFQLAIALVVIWMLKRMAPADYGLHMPTGRSYFVAALGWGVFFGLLMTVVDYAPQLVSGARPDATFQHTTRNVVGWLFFEGVYVGPTEEIPFRALLVTFLATTMPARLRLGRLEMGWAGIVVALIFALSHASNLFVRPWPEALGQQAYALALGVLYAYWLEKSRSVLAPIVGHNVGDFVETAIAVGWSGA